MSIQVGDHEPDFTPKEVARMKVDRLAADLWWTAKELVSLRADPDTRDFFNGRTESDLWSAKSNLDALISELRATERSAA